MRTTTFSKWLSLLLTMVVAGAANAFAQKLTIADFSIEAGATQEVVVSLEADAPVYGIQTDLVLSDGLTLADATAVDETITFAKNEVQGATRMAQLSLAGQTIAAGEVIKLSVTADEAFEGGTITLTNTRLTTTSAGTELKAEDVTANVTLAVPAEFNYELVSISPAPGQVDELYNFTLSFGGQVVTVNEDALLTLTITGTEEVVAEAGIEMAADGNVSVGLADRFTTTGKYTLNIPSGAILYNGTPIDPLSFDYIVGTLPDYTIDPAEGKVESLSTFTIEFAYGVEEVESPDAAPFLFNPETEQEITPIYAGVSGMNKLIVMFDELTTAGQWALIIPSGYLKKTIDETFVPELEFNYTIIGSQAPELVDYVYLFPQALNGWTTIDADGDGYDWSLLISNEVLGQNGLAGMMTSASYAGGTALTPDNYLVSPKLKLDGKITFWANAQDASFPSEHFGVAVSTAGNTDAADFTMVSEEWEMTAARTAKAPRKAQGTWYEYEVDLSSFAGQEGYVAIRHYNCSDWFRLNVDYITLSTSELLADYDPELEVEAELPKPVVLPEGAEVVEYSMSYEDNNGNALNKPVNVAVVGNEVYFQGMSQYLPEAWVKGTLDGNVVTFEANQLMGEYGTYGESYFFFASGTLVSANTFVYDPEADTYTATGQVFGVLGGQYYDGRYFNPVLGKVLEVAATPATPSIEGIEETSYGDVIMFSIPTVDVDGNGMVTSKLSYRFFVDDEETPLVFTTEYFSRLEADMTVIPYGFTEDYDFYADYIYLNMPHDDWTRIGIQSIYTGGGEENVSEIFWFDMPAGPVTPPADLETETYTFTAKATGYDSSVTEDYTLFVQVGFDGDDVYIQGLSQDVPDLWVKATKNAAGQYVVPANQFMGVLSFWGYTFPYYWTAVDADGNMVDAVFDFDPETCTFTSEQTMALNASATELDYNLLFENVVITKFHEVAATPANPTFEAFNISDEVGYTTIYASIPAVDVDGNALDTSKLYYIVWIEKDGVEQPYTFTADLYPSDFDEDVTEVPYSYDGYDIYAGGSIIYLEDELDEINSWTKVGIQSVYYGAGEQRCSDIVWNDGSVSTGITTLHSSLTTHHFYDLQGRRVVEPARGLYIVNGKKVVVK